MSLKVALARTSLALVIIGLPVFAQAQAPFPSDASQSPAANDAPTPPALPPTLVPPPLPPEALHPDVQFFYNDGGKPAGPIGLADLRAKVAAGAIGPATLVWKSGTPNWVPARELAELSSVLCSGAGATGCAQPAAVDPSAHIRSYFLGTWETEGPGPAGTVGPAKMMLSLGQDGKVRGNYVVRLAGSGATASIPLTGTWSVMPISDKQANLTLNLLVHGNNGRAQTMNSTAALEIVDQDTVRDVMQGTITKRVKL
jgi:hypothetical protein